MIFSFEREVPFVRRYSWYRGKTNYQPSVASTESVNISWGVMLMPFIQKPFAIIDKHIIVDAQLDGVTFDERVKIK